MECLQPSLIGAASEFQNRASHQPRNRECPGQHSKLGTLQSIEAYTPKSFEAYLRFQATGFCGYVAKH
jgi:hypothetical protein